MRQVGRPCPSPASLAVHSILWTSNCKSRLDSDTGLRSLLDIVDRERKAGKSAGSTVHRWCTSDVKTWLVAHVLGEGKDNHGWSILDRA